MQDVTNDDKPFGVNLAGYLEAETGVGEAGRAAVRALDAAGVSYVLNNVIDSGSANVNSGAYDFTHHNPYSVNLIHINADQVPIFCAEKGAQYFTGRYNIGYWFWELSQFPDIWYPSFRPFDEIWTASSFIHDALARVSPVPVVRMPPALSAELSSTKSLSRNELGIPLDEFLFLFMFNFGSVLERKNPLGIVEAFKRAFSKRDNTTLVLHVAHPEHDPAAAEVLNLACRESKIRIIDRLMNRVESNTLMAMCDCYVSLHRSEGFGFTIAEAMALEKPVIVTAYSGNMDFTSPGNSLLVKYKLVEIDRDYGPYRKGWVWADPDLDHAAQLMRDVYENMAKAQEIGRQAKQDILELLSPRAVGQQIADRLMRIASMGKGDTNEVKPSVVIEAQRSHRDAN